MEIVTTARVQDDIVEIAFAETPEEAELIQGLLEGKGIPSLIKAVGMKGPMLGVGLLPRGPQRVMVNFKAADDARQLLGETMVETGPEDETEPPTAEAQVAERATRRKPRDYTLVGAYARAYLWSLIAVAVVVGVFLLTRLG